MRQLVGKRGQGLRLRGGVGVDPARAVKDHHLLGEVVVERDALAHDDPADPLRRELRVASVSSLLQDGPDLAGEAPSDHDGHLDVGDLLLLREVLQRGVDGGGKRPQGLLLRGRQALHLSLHRQPHGCFSWLPTRPAVGTSQHRGRPGSSPGRTAPAPGSRSSSGARAAGRTRRPGRRGSRAAAAAGPRDRPPAAASPAA